MSHSSENTKGQRFSPIKFKWKRASHLWRNCWTATSLFCDLYVSSSAVRSDLFSRRYYYYLRLLPWLGKNSIVSTRFGTSTANINYKCTNKWERGKARFTLCLLNIYLVRHFFQARFSRSPLHLRSDYRQVDHWQGRIAQMFNPVPRCIRVIVEAKATIINNRRK